MGKTISFVKGKGSLSHNNRDFVAENVDQDRMDWNVYYIQQSLREAYDQLFGAAVADYNSKQKRKDRWVSDYLTDIKNSGNNEKPFYEVSGCQNVLPGYRFLLPDYFLLSRQLADKSHRTQSFLD